MSFFAVLNSFPASSSSSSTFPALSLGLTFWVGFLRM